MGLLGKLAVMGAALVMGYDKAEDWYKRRQQRRADAAARRKLEKAQLEADRTERELRAVSADANRQHQLERAQRARDFAKAQLEYQRGLAEGRAAPPPVPSTERDTKPEKPPKPPGIPL